MIDHEGQLPALLQFQSLTGFPAKAFIKTVTGPPRAGRKPDTPQMEAVVKAVAQAEHAHQGVELLGFYSHAGDSYSNSTPEQAMDRLAEEIELTHLAAQKANELEFNGQRNLVVAIGATPTASSLQNLLLPTPPSSLTPEKEAAHTRLRTAITNTTQKHTLEFHAGVFPFLDMQQIATGARPSTNDQNQTLLTTSDIAMTILAEVCSLYPERQPKPEVMIAAGNLALGREPCKSYPGWGVVSDWGIAEPTKDAATSWIVNRISQEHGILTNEKEGSDDVDFKIGQKVRIYPNHACITAAGFDTFFVVDRSVKGSEDVVVDVWESWNGW